MSVPICKCTSFLENVPVRKDGFLDVTVICLLAVKHFKHWKELETSDEIIKHVETMIGTPVLDVGKNRHKHTWAHPVLAKEIARWAHTIQSIKPTDGWLYFIQFKEGTPSSTLCIKVGKTTNLQRRIKTHEQSSFYGLNILFSCKVNDMNKSEQDLIDYCSLISTRVSSERFLIKEDQVTEITDKMKSLI